MIELVRVHRAEVAMAVPFDHASQRRRKAESLLVEVVLADGTRGWGEGAPRRYVTGETLDSAIRAVQAYDPGGWHLDDVPIVAGDETSPAARCAVETALLDVVCRRAGRPLVDVLLAAGVPRPLLRTPPTEVPVSLVVHLSRDVGRTLDDLEPETVAALRHVKIKVDDPDGAVRRLAAARKRLGDDTRISLDVNGGWSPADAEDVAPSLRDLGVAWVEEPLAARSWSMLSRLRRRTGLPVMLDESGTGPADVERAARDDAATHVNVRLSKCGGLLNAVRLAVRARELGLACQLGVHVAEVGPLWAASRALATGADLWETVEAGRADEWFPQPLTEPAFQVDRRRYVAAPLPGPGIGVEPAAPLRRALAAVSYWRPGAGWQEEKP